LQIAGLDTAPQHGAAVDNVPASAMIAQPLLHLPGSAYSANLLPYAGMKRKVEILDLTEEDAT
jgi:hypothetical protein